MTLPDLSQLHCLQTIANSGSISGAAQTLNISQPAVSKKIQRLEQFMGTKLIDRSARPLVITQAGHELLNHIPALLGRVHAMVSDVRAASGKTLATLRLGMPDSLSEIMGAELIGSLQALADQIELKSSISPWLEAAFKSRAFDLALDTQPFSETAGIHFEPLFKDPYVIVLPHRLASMPLAKIIETETFVSYNPNHEIRQ